MKEYLFVGGSKDGQRLPIADESIVPTITFRVLRDPLEITVQDIAEKLSGFKDEVYDLIWFGDHDEYGEDNVMVYGLEEMSHRDVFIALIDNYQKTKPVRW